MKRREERVVLFVKEGEESELPSTTSVEVNSPLLYSPSAPMERLHGPINSFAMNSEWHDDLTLHHGHGHHEMPFLQMLQGAMQAEAETEVEDELRRQQQALLIASLPESNLQLLLRLQDQGHHHRKSSPVDVEPSRTAVEQHDSCITHASESQSDARGATDAAAAREKKKRKRPRAATTASAKKAEEMESQRLTHIAVERNRRRLINDHLATLRALIPSSLVRRGDQASIIGGAIDFVKELEQHLLSLQAEKRRRTAAEHCTTLSTSDESALHGGFFVAPQYMSYSKSQLVGDDTKGVDVEATVVQGHVNLKVAGPRREGQLVRAVAAMAELRLSVLHLSVTSLDSFSILYSLNLRVVALKLLANRRVLEVYSKLTRTLLENVQMEDDCQLASADEIATAVHQIFTCINAC